MREFAFIVKRKWWHGSSLQGGRIVSIGKKTFPSYLSKSGGRQPASRSLSPSNGDFVRQHEEQRYGNEP